MNLSIVPPLDPTTPPKPIHQPMIYVKDRMKWEYKIVVRNLESEKSLTEEELNSLGKEGWELSGVAQHANDTYYYFKHLAGS